MRHEDALARLPELVGLHAAASDDGELSAHLAGCERCRARLDACLLYTSPSPRDRS